MHAYTYCMYILYICIWYIYYAYVQDSDSSTRSLDDRPRYHSSASSLPVNFNYDETQKVSAIISKFKIIYLYVARKHTYVIINGVYIHMKNEF